MKIGIYVRVSTREQALEGYSIEEQTERLENYCKAKGYNMYSKYIDPGFSGANMNRPALQKLIEDVKENKLDGVLVYKLDRLSRSQKDTLYLIEDVFLKNNVAFISMSESFDTSTPFGRAVIGILSVFAQLERENIRERTLLGREGRSKNGFFSGNGNPPLGYDYDKETNMLIVNEYEKLQVTKIFELFLEGIPVYEICNIVSNSFKTKQGADMLHPTSVNRMLVNQTYIGKVKFMGEYHDGLHEPIISKEMFDKVQIRFKQRQKEIANGKGNKKPFTGTSLLSGLLFCGDCGARMINRKMDYRKPESAKYLCHSVSKTCKRMIRDLNCTNRQKRWYVKELDEVIINEIKKLSVCNNLKDYSSANNQNEENTILLNKISEIDKKINKLLDLYVLDDIPVEHIKNKITTLENEKNMLNNQIKNNNDDIKLSLDEAKDILLNVNDVFENGTLEDKKRLLNSLILRIEVLNEDIKIFWTF